MLLNLQDTATIREFKEALEDDRFALAKRIWDANPDLQYHFREALLEDMP